MSENKIVLEDCQAQKTDCGGYWRVGPYRLSGCGGALLRVSLADREDAYLSNASGQCCLTHVSTQTPFYLFCQKQCSKHQLSLLSPECPEGWILHL